MKGTVKPDHPAPLIVPRPEHNVSRSDISRSALKVLYRLKDAGYQAFLVGGSVRDLLLGLHPKDFDVATDASPDEVRALFRNSRLIGRRFRLAHVRFGREIIEVATFRGSGNGNGNDEGHREVSEDSGRILRDNIYGTIDEDVWRRDFTANALYYNIADFSIWDYVGGVEDIRNRKLHLIGDAQTRYREDPVRMLRAARFAAKLSFTLHADTRDPVADLGNLLEGVPPARLFDEFLKMFQSGHALPGFRQLLELDLFRYLFPDTARWLETDQPERLEFLEAALANTDQRVAEQRPITPMFLFGVFLWGAVDERARELQDAHDMSVHQSLVSAAADLTADQVRRIALPKRFSYPMREMIQLQPRFQRRRGKRAMDFLSHPRFRAAYDLLDLRRILGDCDDETFSFWTEVQQQSTDERRKSFGLAGKAGGAGAGKRRRRKRGPRRRRSAAAPGKA